MDDSTTNSLQPIASTTPQYEFKIFSGTTHVRRGTLINWFLEGGNFSSIDWAKVDEQLNGFLAEGWEVFSANASSYGNLMFGIGTQDPIITFVLRRLRQS